MTGKRGGDIAVVHLLAIYNCTCILHLSWSFFLSLCTRESFVLGNTTGGVENRSRSPLSQVYFVMSMFPENSSSQEHDHHPLFTSNQQLQVHSDSRSTFPPYGHVSPSLSPSGLPTLSLSEHEQLLVPYGYTSSTYGPSHQGEPHPATYRNNSYLETDSLTNSRVPSPSNLHMGFTKKHYYNAVSTSYYIMEVQSNNPTPESSAFG